RNSRVKEAVSLPTIPFGDLTEDVYRDIHDLKALLESGERTGPELHVVSIERPGWSNVGCVRSAFATLLRSFSDRRLVVHYFARPNETPCVRVLCRRLGIEAVWRVRL